MVKGGLTLFLLLGASAWAKPPAPLICVQKFYAARPVEKNALWYVTVPDGSKFLYDFGEQKPFDERLRVPDVQDMFGLRYSRGPIAPVSEPDQDPGRIRHAPLFDATYPMKDLQKAKFFEHPVTLQKRVLPALERVEARLKKAIAADARLAPFVKKLGASFAARDVAGTAVPSAHAYGIAIDLNPELSTYWRWQKPPEPVTWTNRLPQGIVDAFEAEGFIWGGRWYHYDTGHFEYRPELLDPACYEGK
jgi:hypothetical protein